MRIVVLALLSTAATAAPAQPAPAIQPVGPVVTLEQALASVGEDAPTTAAASADVAAARATRDAAALRPNPTLQGEVENVAGSGPYRGLRSAETTVGVALPIELGGKRGARIGVADAQLARAELATAVVRADLRLQVVQAFVAAAAAEQRVGAATDRAGFAREAARAAGVRVRAGRASPIEEQRADVASINAQAEAERLVRLAATARANLSRRTGLPLDVRLDTTMLDRLPTQVSGPASPPDATGTLALAAAEADLVVADAGVRLARAGRVPDLTVGPAVRRLGATNDTAAVFSISIPIPVFNTGRAAVAQAVAERGRADARRRVTALDVEQAIGDAQAEAANALTAARAAKGPALAAATEAARIARIGYREGKFGQLELLDAERTLADTRLAVIDALAAYHDASARLARLTVRAPQETPR